MKTSFIRSAAALLFAAGVSTTVMAQEVTLRMVDLLSGQPYF